MEELIGKEFEENTLKGYRTCLLHLTGYIQKKYKSDDLAINDNDRIYIMAVPYIGGYNPDYSGLDFSEAAFAAIVKTLLPKR